MFRELMEFLSGIKMTIISAFFLIAGLGFMLVDIHPTFNPVWLTIIISGTPIVYRAFNKLLRCRCVSSPLLITCAMAAAIAIGELFAAGEVALIMAIGEILEDITVDRAKHGLGRLLELTPVEGRRITADGEEKVSVQDIHAGDILRVLPGETIPVDGSIIKGDTSVSQAMLTGESLPVDKTAGDTVFAGTINCFGSIDIKTDVAKDTYLQRMINLVKEAQNNKAPTQLLVDKWASILVPSALIIALLTYFITGEAIRAVTVLVVFCPCALVLATPTAIMAAIGNAAKNGVLIKSGTALEEMGRVNMAVFDKTGTLTTGNLSISDIIPLQIDMKKKELLAIAASIEQYSEHTLAKAIVAEAKDESIILEAAETFEMIPGKGICGKVGHANVRAGNMKFIEESGISFSDRTRKTVTELQAQGKALVIIAKNDSVIGIIALSDTPRDSTTDTIRQLNSLQVNVAVLTGDSTAAAHYFAKQTGVTDVYADLLPADKVYKIKELQAQGYIVCMTGDGINDAPALKTANVGIAMGRIGSDIAIDAADIALIKDDISCIPYLKKLSNLTLQTIKINLTLSLLVNAAGLTLGILGFMGPLLGALLHNVGSIAVILYSSRIYIKAP